MFMYLYINSNVLSSSRSYLNILCSYLYLYINSMFYPQADHISIYSAVIHISTKINQDWQKYLFLLCFILSPVCGCKYYQYTLVFKSLCKYEGTDWQCGKWDWMGSRWDFIYLLLISSSKHSSTRWSKHFLSPEKKLFELVKVYSGDNLDIGGQSADSGEETAWTFSDFPWQSSLNQ